MSDDEVDIEALLARELAGYAPEPHVENSDPLGSQVVNWRTLRNEDAADEWRQLREWVEWFAVRYAIPHSTVPTCWWQHGALVEELSALHTAHLAAFHDTDSGYGPISWHERLTPATARLTRAYGGGCTHGHQTLKPRSWTGATDEQEWDTWITQTHATEAHASPPKETP